MKMELSQSGWKMMNRVSIAVLVVGLAAFASCRKQSAGAQIAQRVKECGVEKYKAIAHQECGLVYSKKSDPSCRLIGYVSGPHRDCPGYKPRKTREVTGTYCSDLKCKSKETEDGCRSEEVECPDFFARPHCRPRVTLSCIVQQEEIAICPRPEFGEIREACLDDQVIGVKTCELERDWNVESYKDCGVIKTREELEAYLETTKNNIPVMGLLLIAHRADFLRATSGMSAMACLIKRLKADPAYSETGDELASSHFLPIFGEPYQESLCNPDEPAPENIEQVLASCQDADKAPKCKTARAHSATRLWFGAQQEMIERLKGDLVAQQDALMRENLEKLQQELTTALQTSTVLAGE
jgi:hypothetical protein